jgi:Fe-S-cluster containining protein
MAEDDDARLEALVGALMAAPARRVPIAPVDADAITARLAVQVDRAADARAEASARQGLPVVCSRGCNGCCEEPIMVWAPEAQIVARWLMAPAQAEIRARFLAAFPAWQRAAGDGPRRLAELTARRDGAAYLAEHRAQWARRVLCAFNHDGDCSIYPVRPLTCRNGHAVETHERCSGANAGGQPAARLQFPPLDDYLISADAVLRAVHGATRDDRKVQALCEAVHRLLQSAMAAARKADRSR